MNTNNNDEDTKYTNDDENTNMQDSEATSYETESNGQEENQEGPEAEGHADSGSSENAPEADGKSKWKKAAVGAGIGVALGGVAAMTMGMQSADNVAEPIGPSPDPSDPWWSNGGMRIAVNVNDNMTKDEAFAAAREEVGPGGAFEWHGNVYHTYTAEEWSAMSPAEQHAFNDHFTWNNGSEGHSTGHTGQSHANHAHTAQTHVEPTDPTHPTEQNHTAAGNATASTDTPAGDGDDIDIISVDHPGDNNLTAEVQTHEPGGEDIIATGNDDILVTPAEPEVEILGVVHDAEAGANIGGMLVDGQEVLVVDVDGDMTFDVMASDLNHNGTLEANEVVDIHTQGLTVADMGGFSNPTDDLMASNGAPDYSSDPIDPAYEN